MTRAKESFLNLISCAVTRHPIHPVFSEDWDEIFKLAAIHSCEALVAFVVLNDKCAEIPTEIQQKLKKILISQMIFTENQDHLNNILFNELEEKGIDFVCFKGPIVRELYPDKCLRTYGDIDILIRDSDRQLSRDIMINRGFCEDIPIGSVLSYKKKAQNFEIHDNIMYHNIGSNSLFRSYLSDAWAHASKSECGFGFRFDNTFHFIYVIIHLAKHCHHRGAGIRMLLDVCFFINGCTDLDWDIISVKLKEFKLWDFATKIFSLCQLETGVQLPLEICDLTVNEHTALLEFFINGGVFGYETDNKAVAHLRKNGGDRSSKFKTIVKEFFPSRETLIIALPSCQNHVMLFPLAWLKWGLSSLNRLSKKLNNVAKIAKVSDAEIKSSQQFLQFLGLYWDD